MHPIFIARSLMRTHVTLNLPCARRATAKNPSATSSFCRHAWPALAALERHAPPGGLPAATALSARATKPRTSGELATWRTRGREQLQHAVHKGERRIRSRRAHLSGESCVHVAAMTIRTSSKSKGRIRCTPSSHSAGVSRSAVFACQSPITDVQEAVIVHLGCDLDAAGRALGRQRPASRRPPVIALDGWDARIGGVG